MTLLLGICRYCSYSPYIYAIVEHSSPRFSDSLPHPLCAPRYARCLFVVLTIGRVLNYWPEDILGRCVGLAGCPHLISVVMPRLQHLICIYTTRFSRPLISEVAKTQLR